MDQVRGGISGSHRSRHKGDHVSMDPSQGSAQQNQGLDLSAVRGKNLLS